MTAALVIAWTVLGGLWRRAMGGWLGISRSTIVWAGLAVLSLPVGLLVGKVLWWPYGVAAYAFHVGLSFLFFVVSFYPGGKFTDDRDVMLRYGPFGLSYVLAHRFWREEWRIGGFIDGSNAVGEIGLGALWYLPVAACWLWVL